MGISVCAQSREVDKQMELARCGGHKQSMNLKIPTTSQGRQVASRARHGHIPFQDDADLGLAHDLCAITPWMNSGHRQLRNLITANILDPLKLRMPAARRFVRRLWIAAPAKICSGDVI